MCAHVLPRIAPSRSSLASRCAAGGRPPSLLVRAGVGFGLKTKSTALNKNGQPALVKGRVSPMQPVPPHIPRPPYAESGKMPPVGPKPEVHDAQGIAKMRAAGRLAAEVLEYAGTLVKAGVTTDAIDRAVHAKIIAAGAYPSPLNYGAFPKSVCTSVNECICHGIPDDRPLANGDIVNIDVTVYLDGYHGDTSRMFLVGEVSETARRLCEVTHLALEAAIKVCGPGVPLKEIGATIHSIADKHRFAVVRDFIGHGVGKAFHASPQVLHHRNSEPGTMQVNQTFTIEPMISAGGTKVKFWKDNWTAVTADLSLVAQYEHTLLITPNGAEILTKL